MSYPVTKFGKIEKEILDIEDEIVSLPFIIDNFLSKEGGEITGEIDMSGQAIKNLPDPVDGQDAATKNYIDSSQGHSFFRRLPGRGYAAVKDLDMNENRLLNLGMPTDNREAANKLYTDITANDVKQSLEGHNPFYLNTDKHKARGDIDMLNFKIEGLPMPVNEKDASNKIFTETLVENRRRQLEAKNPFNLEGGDFVAKNKINMKGNKIENVGFPDLPEDVATVGYVDEANVWERKNGGFVAKEHIYLGKKKLGGLREPTADGEAANKKYVDEELKKVTGETLKKGNDGFYSAETNLNLNNFRLFGVPDPTREDEVSNKKYVDEKTANIQPAAAGVDPAELDKIKTELEKNQAFNTRNQKTFNARGNINMKQKTIRNVPDPVEVTDVVSKGYVDEMKEFFEDRIKEVEDEAKETKEAVDRVSRLQPGGGAGNGNSADFGDMKGKKLINVGDPENPGDGVNRKYVDQKTPFTKTNGYYTTTHGLDMDFKKITNLNTPTGAGDASNKKYVDDSINNIETGLIRRNGGFQAIDAIDMNSNRIKNVGDPQVYDDAVTKRYVDEKDLKAFEREGEYIKSKQTILMDGKTIEQLGAPNFLTDAVNKEYVDEKLKTIPFTKVNGHFIASSELDMGVKKITNLARALDGEDAVNKDYVDEKVSKLTAEDQKRKKETDRIRILVNDKIENIEKEIKKREFASLIEKLVKSYFIFLENYESHLFRLGIKGTIEFFKINPDYEIDQIFFTFLNSDSGLIIADDAEPVIKKMYAIARKVLKDGNKKLFNELIEKYDSLDDVIKNDEEELKKIYKKLFYKLKKENDLLVPSFLKLNGHFLALGEVDMDKNRIKNLADPTDENDVTTKKYVDEKTQNDLSKERIFKFLGSSIILLRAEGEGPIVGTEEILNSNNRQPSPNAPGGFIAYDANGEIIEPTILYFGRYDGGKERYPKLLIPTVFKINKYAIYFEGSTSESFDIRIQSTLQNGISRKQDLTFHTSVIESNKMFCSDLLTLVDSTNFENCNTLFLSSRLSHPNVTRFFITLVCLLHIPDFNEKWFPTGFNI